MEKAKDYIADEQWPRAIEVLRAASADPKERNRDEALFWLAHSLHQARDLAGAVETIAELERNFPASRWVKPARSLRVELAQKLRRDDVLWWTATPSAATAGASACRRSAGASRSGAYPAPPPMLPRPVRHRVRRGPHVRTQCRRRHRRRHRPRSPERCPPPPPPATRGVGVRVLRGRSGSADPGARQPDADRRAACHPDAARDRAGERQSQGSKPRGVRARAIRTSRCASDGPRSREARDRNRSASPPSASWDASAGRRCRTNCCRSTGSATRA